MLEFDRDATVGGVFDGLLGLVIEAVVSETVSQEQGRGTVTEQSWQRVSEGALTQQRTLGVAAHLRWMICVSLRRAANVVAPYPMRFRSRLRARGGAVESMVEELACQRALTQRGEQSGAGSRARRPT